LRAAKLVVGLRLPFVPVVDQGKVSGGQWVAVYGAESGLSGHNIAYSPWSQCHAVRSLQKKLDLAKKIGAVAV